MAAGRPACAADERQDAEEPAKSLQGKYSSACSNKGISRPNAAAWLLVSLLGFLRGPASAQRSKPVSNTNQFAAALQDASISEIILDPSGAGVRGNTATHLLYSWTIACCVSSQNVYAACVAAMQVLRRTARYAVMNSLSDLDLFCVCTDGWRNFDPGGCSVAESYI